MPSREILLSGVHLNMVFPGSAAVSRENSGAAENMFFVIKCQLKSITPPQAKMGQNTDPAPLLDAFLNSGLYQCIHEVLVHSLSDHSKSGGDIIGA